MKRIISLGLAALILLGTLTGGPDVCGICGRRG